MLLLLVPLLALGTTPTCHAPGVFVKGIEDDQEDYVPGGNGPRDDGPDGNDPDGDRAQRGYG